MKQTTSAASGAAPSSGKYGGDHLPIATSTVPAYRDYANEIDSDTGNGKQENQDSFPVKLHYMMSDMQTDGLRHVVSWQPHGRAFIVHKPKDFGEKILPLWFRMSKFSSFQRQLNLYGFRRITAGPDKGAYYHESFLRGRRHLANRIRRIKIKGQGARKPSNPEEEPDLYSKPFLPETELLVPKPNNTTAAMAAAPTATATLEVSRNAIAPPQPQVSTHSFMPVPSVYGLSPMFAYLVEAAMFPAGANARLSSSSSHTTHATLAQLSHCPTLPHAKGSIPSFATSTASVPATGFSPPSTSINAKKNQE